MKKVLIGIFGVLALVFVGLVITSNNQGEEEVIGVPPGIVIDSGYNATLSGTPFYIVTSDDENMYDDSLDTCAELGGEDDRQQGWYSVVAHQDGMTVREVVFEQANLEEGDSMLAVYYNPSEKSFEAMPNRIIKAAGGADLPLLDWNTVLEEGEVVVVNSNRSVDFCKDYAEAVDHEVVTVGSWNLVSRPDFDAVGYRSIWSVDFSGQNLNQFYREGDANFDPSSLEDDILYWVYGGELASEDNGSETEGSGTEGSGTEGNNSGNENGGENSGSETDGNTGTEGSGTEGGSTGTVIDVDPSIIDRIGDLFGSGNDDLVVIDQRETGGITLNPGFGGIDFGDFATGTPVFSIDDVFSVGGRGTVVTGTVASGEISAGDEVTLQCGNFSENFTVSEVDGEDSLAQGDEGALLFPSEVANQIDCNQGEGLALKLKDDRIDYKDDIVLLAPKNVDRRDPAISLQFGSRPDNREYVIFWEPSADNARTIRIRPRDDINDAWAGCSQIRVTVSGLTFQDGTNVEDGEFDVTVNDNGQCDTIADQPFEGMNNYQDFAEIPGTVRSVHYDEVGRGFWAINNNGQIFENFSQGDGEWRLLPGMTPLSRAVCTVPADGGTNNCVRNFVNDDDDFYVMAGETNQRIYSLIAWEGVDGRFYRYDYSGTNLIDGNVDQVEKFGSSGIDTVEGKYDAGNGEMKDVLYVRYDCDRAVTGTVGRNADPKAYYTCNIQRMTEFGDTIGLNGNDFPTAGDRFFASDTGALWSINSPQGEIYRHQLPNGGYDRINTSGRESFLSEIVFNGSNVFGINSARNVFYWNDLQTAWMEVRSTNQGSDRLSSAEHFGEALVRAEDGGGSFRLFELDCSSVQAPEAPGEEATVVDCRRSDERGVGHQIDVAGTPISPVQFAGTTYMTLNRSVDNIYKIERTSSDRRLRLVKGLGGAYGDNAEIKQVISAGQKLFVFVEENGRLSLSNMKIGE